MANRKNNNEPDIELEIAGRRFVFERKVINYRNVGQLNEAGERLGSEIARMAEPLMLAEQELSATKSALEAFWETALYQHEKDGKNEAARKGFIRENYAGTLAELEEDRRRAAANHVALTVWFKSLQADHSAFQTMSANNREQRNSTK